MVPKVHTRFDFFKSMHVVGKIGPDLRVFRVLGIRLNFESDKFV